jgi:hypothetical protein
MITMRRAFLAVLALAVLVAGGVAMAGGSRRVVKNTVKAPIRMYWAQQLDATHVQIYPFPYGAKVNDEFDLADQQGYLGRAKVTKVEEQPAGCNGVVFYIATAAYADAPQRQAIGNAIAFSPQPRLDPHRAVVLQNDSVANPPSDMVAHGQPAVVLDWDGDHSPDLVRYYYDCQGVASSGAQGVMECMDTFQRTRTDTWALLEHISINDCY